MKIGELRNGHGAPVSLHRCQSCGAAFTVTPATDNAWGLGCLAETCESYDLVRDPMPFWETASEAGIIWRSGP